MQPPFPVSACSSFGFLSKHFLLQGLRRNPARPSPAAPCPAPAARPGLPRSLEIFSELGRCPAPSGLTFLLASHRYFPAKTSSSPGKPRKDPYRSTGLAARGRNVRVGGEGRAVQWGRCQDARLLGKEESAWKAQLTAGPWAAGRELLALGHSEKSCLRVGKKNHEAVLPQRR